MPVKLLFVTSVALVVAIALIVCLWIFGNHQASLGVEAVESMGGSVGVNGTTRCGPNEVHLKVSGVESNATDSELQRLKDLLSHLCNVEHLDLADTPVGDKGFTVLMEIWGSGLKRLEVANTKLSSESIQKSLSVGQLAYISLSAQSLTPALVAEMVQSKKLKMVKLYGYSDSESSVDQLVDRLKGNGISVATSARLSLKSDG